ncbi:hypothetical protein D1AOALGA4SA_12950 [Olavius algarvensis Delta 1 endosymbiont]|nr:hypothetical protein D1AOALGA4SA_12950 [Olavius algarvensis Delta 1 endosymbiont]
MLDKLLNQKVLQDNKYQCSLPKDQILTPMIITLFHTPGPPIMTSCGLDNDGSLVWNFEFGSLGFI